MLQLYFLFAVGTFFVVLFLQLPKDDNPYVSGLTALIGALIWPLLLLNWIIGEKK